MSEKKNKNVKRMNREKAVLERDLSPEYYEAVAGLSYLEPEYMAQAKARSEARKKNDEDA